LGGRQSNAAMEGAKRGKSKVKVDGDSTSSAERAGPPGERG